MRGNPAADRSVSRHVTALKREQSKAHVVQKQAKTLLVFATFLLITFWKIFFMIIDLISFRYLKIIMKQSTIFVNPIHKK